MHFHSTPQRGRRQTKNNKRGELLRMEHTAYQHVRVLTLVLAIIKIKYFLNDDLSLNTHV